MILGENFPPLGSDCQDRSRGVAGSVGRKGGRLAEGAGGLVVHWERERLARTADEGLLIGGSGGLRRTHERVHPDQGDPEQEKDRSSQAARFHHLQG
jgi:hypothetical protein